VAHHFPWSTPLALTARSATLTAAHDAFHGDRVSSLLVSIAALLKRGLPSTELECGSWHVSTEVDMALEPARVNSHYINR